MDSSSSSSMRKPVPRTVRNWLKKQQVKDAFDRIKQAEKKQRRLDKAIATSAAIRAELEQKKQRKKAGQQEVGEEISEDDDDAKKKDELDRIRQAEKKKTRLEKSIATSAAIRAELEKKKLKKLEEQRRLDEEGAAIAEAVALHVLLGEDCDESSYRYMLNQETGFKPCDYTAGRRNTLFHHQRCSSYYNRPRESNWSSSVSYEPFARGWDDNNMGISADLIVAQAVVTTDL